MVMKPGPVSRALDSIDRTKDRSLVLLLTPQGRTFDQPLAWDLSRMSKSSSFAGATKAWTRESGRPASTWNSPSATLS